MATFVLVHGAWHGGWCWQRVRPLLRQHGHEVFTPTLTGLGERSHPSGRMTRREAPLAAATTEISTRASGTIKSATTVVRTGGASPTNVW